MAGAGTARKKGKKGRKTGRSSRPGQKHGAEKTYAGIRARKMKRILKSNGKAFLDSWIAGR